MSLKDKIEKYNCKWLKDYIKELKSVKDLKTYNRLKCVMYYFPDALLSNSLDDIKIAFKHADDTYICLGSDDYRYSVLDKLYEKLHNGKEFIAPKWGEDRYITIDELCKFFGV